MAPRVEVVYVLPGGEEDCAFVELPEGRTALDAVRASGVLERHPEIDLQRHRLGIYGRIVAPGAPLAPGDRVEIYRPLAMDPKEARRRRAARRSPEGRLRRR
jgi:putative ubiquitin-RnfH superfamily antitoxin RatB of RatAB toxin-antitoxin module